MNRRKTNLLYGIILNFEMVIFETSHLISAKGLFDTYFR